MTWTVTRQSQWPTGDNVVEVSAGGIDYTNPDALVKCYEGEFETFDNPITAAEAAISICKQWRIDHKGKHRPTVGTGATGGMTMPFEPTTFTALRLWARETWHSLEKCGCGKPLPDKRHRWRADDWSGEEFCSEYCADKEIEYQAQQQELDEEERD